MISNIGSLIIGKNLISPTSSIKEVPLPSVSDVFGDDEKRLTEEEMNMIMEVNAKIDHDRMLNGFQKSTAEEIVYRQEELFLGKRFVAAEQAILSHNFLTQKIPNTYKTTMSSVNAAE
jgi:hypothetical protein